MAYYPITSYRVLVLQRDGATERSVKYAQIDASVVQRAQIPEPHYVNPTNPTEIEWDDPDAPGKKNRAPFNAQAQLPPGTRYAVILNGYTAGGETPVSLPSQEFTVTAGSTEPLQIPPAPTGVAVTF